MQENKDVTARLSRRKYAVATKALNRIIASETVGVDKRLKAIALLLDLHARHDAAQERAERRAERKSAGLPPEPVEQTDAVPTAVQTAETTVDDEDIRLRSAYEKFLPKAGSVAELPDGHRMTGDP